MQTTCNRGYSLEPRIHLVTIIPNLKRETLPDVSTIMQKNTWHPISFQNEYVNLNGENPDALDGEYYYYESGSKEWMKNKLIK